MMIGPPKILKVGDPVAINGNGMMIKWEEGCGFDMRGYLPEGSHVIDGYMVIPSWFAKQISGDFFQ